MKIAGLVGQKRAGKSTAADVLVRERGFISIGFADALKDLALRANPTIAETESFYGGPLTEIVDAIGWDHAKEFYPEVRRFLQELGTGVRDIDPQFWVNALERKVAALPRDACVVIPDVRFENEAHYVRWFGYRDDRVLLIRITRPELDSSDTHISETEQLGIECDTEILNMHSKAWFEDCVDAAVHLWMETGSVDVPA